MHEIRINTNKNVLYITLKGFLKDDEVRDVVKEIIDKAKQLSPGFIVVNDISEFSPASKNVLDEIKKAQAFVKTKGVKRIIRVVGNVLTKNQLKYTQQCAGLDNEVIEVNSLTEVDQYL